MSKILKRGLWSISAVLVAAILAVGWLTRDLALTNVNVLLNAITGRGIDTPPPELLQSRLQLPEGFSLSLYADNLPMARMMAVTETGDLLVSRPRAGEVVWLRDSDGDGRADSRRVVLSGLDRPHGLALWKQWLYVAETDAIGRVRFNSATGGLDGRYERLITGLPGGGNHWSRSIAFGPDQKLYVAVGSSCNVCEETDPRRAAISRFNPDGSDAELFATGLRNTVGLDFAPWSGALYGTDNGRDLLGDDFPPCELNRIERGGFYGWPYVNGFGAADPDLGGKWSDAGGGTGRDQPMARSPAHGFGAHTAPLGMRFLRNLDWPGYDRAALVALHGSWNRTTPAGYKVVALYWRPDGEIEQRDFLHGFEVDGEVIGRPVDIVLDGDGGVFISDDYAGAIYRVRYGAPPSSRQSAPVGGKMAPPAGAVPKIRSEAVAADFEALAPLQRARLVTAGRDQYRRWPCASCHEGPAARPLNGLRSRYDIDQLASFLETPTPPMPAYPMDPAERRALAVYLLASHP